jgi:hypothetical protein
MPKTRQQVAARGRDASDEEVEDPAAEETRKSRFALVRVILVRALV